MDTYTTGSVAAVVRATAASFVSLTASTVAHGEFAVFESLSSWQQIATANTVIDFTGFANNTFISNQYASLGVLFTDTDPNVIQNALFYPLDGAGIYGVCKVELTFDQPMRAFGAQYLGSGFVRAYLNDQIVYQGPHLPGAGFVGIVAADSTFDRVLLYDYTTPNPPYYCDSVTFDNFWFSTVPAPSALCIIGVASLLGGRSRRRRVGYSKRASEFASRAG